MESFDDQYTLAREAFASGHLSMVQTGFAPTDALLQFNDPTTTFVPTLEHPLKISLKCQLALLWAILGHKEAASALASSIKPMIENGLISLGTPEKEYDEREALVSAALLLRSFGHDCPRPTDPFLAFLYDKDPKIAVSTLPHLIKDEHGVFSLSDSEQVGAFRFGEIFVPAFGPHVAPLSNSDTFGIATSLKGWFCAKGDKESWFQIEALSSHMFNLQSIANRSVPFAFYVKAQECLIGDKVYKPKSLQRHLSTESSVRFRNKGQIVQMGFDQPLPIELIPLAGEGPFWGASFLLAFTIPPMSGKLTFNVW